MEITIDQAEAFDLTVRLGTIQKAATALNKGHSAVMYLIKSLEQQTGLMLFDRSGYRNQVSRDGEVVLFYCRQILKSRSELSQKCEQLKGGWESRLDLIYDGVIDFSIIGEALYLLKKTNSPTRINISTAYLNEVESEFESRGADIMATVLPIRNPHIDSIKLAPIKMFLVAHRDLKLNPRRKISTSKLQGETFIRIKESADQLGLSTERAVFNTTFLVNDFATKKLAILKRLGFGWLPEYLIEKELDKNILTLVKSEIENSHVLKPRVYHRGQELIGKTAQQLLKNFKSI